MFKGLINAIKNFFADDLSEASVPEVMEIFCNPDANEDRRTEAAEQLTEFSSKFSDLDTSKPSTIRLANETYTQLLEVIDREDEDDWVYEKAISGLNEIVNVCRYDMDKRLLRESNEALIELLSPEETDEVRSAAASALSSLSDVLPEEHNQRAIDVIEKYLDDPSDSVRGDFIFNLGSFGDKAADLWSDVSTYLDDPSATVRARAASALWMIGKESPSPAVIDRLIDMLANDRSDEVRSDVANTLGQLGKGFPSVIDALVDALNDEAARHMALFAFSDIGEEADAALDAIEPFLDHEDHSDSAEIVLQSIGTPAARAILRAHGRDEE